MLNLFNSPPRLSCKLTPPSMDLPEPSRDPMSLSSNSNLIRDGQLQPLSLTTFTRMPPYYIDIDKTDRFYKERLAADMASSIRRGVSPSASLLSLGGERRGPTLHLIMLVGLVASGKSTLAQAVVRAFKGYALVTGQDVDEEAKWEEEWDKCVITARAAFESGMSVIVDLPNETPEKRRKWIDLAEKYGASIDAIVLETTEMTCGRRIDRIYVSLYGNGEKAAEESQHHHRRLRSSANRYIKPANPEFAGRLIFLPEGVQSRGYWSAEKLRRFLPDVASQQPSTVCNRSSPDLASVDEGLSSADVDEAGGTQPTGTSSGSDASGRLKAQALKGSRRHNNSFLSNLNSLPQLGTAQDFLARKCSPNALSIRVSPRRRKRTHERRPTIAIPVAELAVKASPPLASRRDHAGPGRESGPMHRWYDQGNENSMNELILECPTSPVKPQEEAVSRGFFSSSFGHENIPQSVTVKPSGEPTENGSNGRRDEDTNSRGWDNILAPIPHRNVYRSAIEDIWGPPRTQGNSRPMTTDSSVHTTPTMLGLTSDCILSMKMQSQMAADHQVSNKSDRDAQHYDELYMLFRDNDASDGISLRGSLTSDSSTEDSASRGDYEEEGTHDSIDIQNLLVELGDVSQGDAGRMVRGGDRERMENAFTLDGIYDAGAVSGFYETSCFGETEAWRERVEVDTSFSQAEEEEDLIRL